MGVAEVVGFRDGFHAGFSMVVFGVVVAAQHPSVDRRLQKIG